MSMKPINWDPKKNQQLIENRGISFEDVVFYLNNDGLLDEIAHPNVEKYPHQRMFIVEIEQYACLIPYVENDEEIFLKTIIPNRKATKHYLGGKNE